MSFTGIQATVNFYTMQESDLTNRLSDIMHQITRATSKSTELLENTTEKRAAVNQQATESPYYADSTEYEVALQEIEDEYELELAKITEWESELEMEKEHLETELQATSSFKESFSAALKENVQRDMKYAQSQ